MTNVPYQRQGPSNTLIQSRRLLLPTLVALTLGGCATQEFVQKEVGQHDERVRSLESWFNAVNQGMDTQAKRILNAETRMDRAEQAGASLAARLDETRAELAGTGQRVDRLTVDLTGANQRIDAGSAEAARAHQRLNGQDARLNATHRRLEGTTAGLALAEGRIGALEHGALRQGLVSGTADSGMAPVPPAIHPASLPMSQPMSKPMTQPIAQAVTPLPAQPPGQPAGQTTAKVSETTGHALQSDSALIAELNRKIEQQSRTLATAIDRLAGLEAALAAPGPRSREQEPALSATHQKFDELQSDIALLRKQGESHAAAIARIDQRVSGMDSELESAHKRVEAGEQVLAESGLRLTLVQDLLKGHGERLARNEIEDGKVSTTAREALERAQLAGKLAEGKLVFETTLTDEVANFGFQDARLGEAARRQLDEFANRLKAENRGAFIEIQGHTDSVGPAEANLRLSRERATAVRDYLYQEAKIPLHLLAVAAYGETRPVADNGTREGRGKNRRVVLVVLR